MQSTNRENEKSTCSLLRQLHKRQQLSDLAQDRLLKQLTEKVNNTKSSQSCSPITLSLSLQTYLVIIQQLGSQQSSLWSDAAAQRAKQRCTFHFIPFRGLWRLTPSGPAGPAHLALPHPHLLFPSLTLPITFSHSCRVCLCRAHVQVQDIASCTSNLENPLAAQLDASVWTADRTALFTEASVHAEQEQHNQRQQDQTVFQLNTWINTSQSPELWAH